MSTLTDKEQQYVYEVMENHKVSICKILPSQRLALYDVSSKKLAKIELDIFKKIHKPNGLKVTYVQACPGLQQCKNGVADALSMGREIERLNFAKPFPHKVKVSIAGCKICCTEPYIRDVGVIAGHNGWTVVFGGNGGGRPRIADQIGKDLKNREAINLIQKSLDFYLKNGLKKQRTARFVEQIGIDALKKNFL